MAQQLMQILSTVTNKVGIISTVLKVPEQEVHDYLDAEIDALYRAEEGYYETEYPAVLKQLKEMVNDVLVYQRREMRRRYLFDEIQRIKPEYLETQDEKLGKRLRSLLFESKVYLGEVNGITIERMVQARIYPITSLIEHRGFMALCPFHKEKTPSLNLKKNFYFCHGCGESGDVIDFVMKTKSLTFKQAVELLTTK